MSCKVAEANTGIHSLAMAVAVSLCLFMTTSCLLVFSLLPVGGSMVCLLTSYFVVGSPQLTAHRHHLYRTLHEHTTS